MLPLKSGTTGSTFNYPVDAPTQSIVTTAVNNANVLGAQPLGNIGGAFHRAKLANGTSENRGGESTLGNQVAEIQRWATSDPAFGAAQIAFMNPGGLRADLVGQGSSAYPRVVTYKDAANVQPFANTLVNEDLTGPGSRRRWSSSGSRSAPRGRSSSWASARASPTPTTRTGRRARGSPACTSTGQRSTWTRRTR